MNSCGALLVNSLLTISIKVNVPFICRIRNSKRGLKMKKIKTSRGFWDWLLGGGYSGTGGHG